ncbi:MAG: M42 family metallopeptidase [bacterium]
MEIDNLLEIDKLLEELIMVPGVIGYEDPVRKRIKELIEGCVDRVEVDALGNLTGLREGDGKRHIAFFAHMDELGLVVTNITSDGFIRFKKMGGLDDRVLPSRHVKLFTAQGAEIPGVVAWIPPHMALDGQKSLDKVAAWHELVIDLGARNAEEVTAMGVRIGDPIVFSKQISRLANNLMASRGIDNRAGCAALVALIQSTKEVASEHRISFIFTTQEEYGLHGASTAGYRARPDGAFIIDTASAPDFPGVPEIFKGQFQLGKGPLLRLVDGRMIAHQGLRSFVEGLAQEQNIPFQLGVVGGTTDAAAVQLAGGGIPTLPVCIPCRYTHAMVETVSLDDLKATVDLLRGIIERYS